jgi:diguanylate cyclase (GGDEF)-like protein/PAS domain S-box-containing protein
MELCLAQYKQILDNFSEAVYCVDKQRKIIYWNRTAERLTGYSADEVVGSFCEDGPMQHVDMLNRPLCEGHCPLVRCIATEQEQEKLVFALHKDGRRIPLTVKTSPLYAEDGSLFGAVEMFSDASELLQIKELNTDLLRQTHLDALTGVPNKQAFFDAMEREWYRFKRYHTPFSLLALDIDYFDQLNDAYGRATGDAVLVWLTKQLNLSIRRADILGCMGADKFMILLSFSNRKSTLKVANMILEMVRQEPCLDLELAMTVSMGAVSIEDGETVDDVVGRVEKALERSKDMGRNQVTFWG